MNKLFTKNPLVFPSSEGNVWKYVFEFHGAVAEAVLYRYNSFEERTVLCVSIQSGCPVGCQFCGSGGKFIRNLSFKEIVEQVVHILNDKKIDSFKCKKLQIMFMSMGEPFLNYTQLSVAIHDLGILYPNAQLLVSTIAPKQISALTSFIGLSKNYENIGLQFSIHASNDSQRDQLIPYKHKLNLREIRNYGIEWWKETKRKPYCNYCINGTNNSDNNFQELVNIFPPNVFCFTFSVVCSSLETMKDAGYKNIETIKKFEEMFIAEGYDTRIFDPAGQDDIGGGCGQLWYVQQWMKEHQYV